MSVHPHERKTAVESLPLDLQVDVEPSEEVANEREFFCHMVQGGSMHKKKRQAEEEGRAKGPRLDEDDEWREAA